MTKFTLIENPAAVPPLASDRNVQAFTVRRPERNASPLADVEVLLARYVAYPSEHARVAHCLWVQHAHAIAAFESTPRIAFLSAEPASGKTRALEVTELLVPRPVPAVNVTPAYLFRKVGDGPITPTVLFDEIDTIFGPKARNNEEIRGLLNAGHRRGAVAGRCVIRGKNIETEDIPAFCAVAIAGIGDIPDTIASRSIIIHMRRRAHHESVRPFRRRACTIEAEPLRESLAHWAAENLAPLADARPEMPAGVQDRDADVWEPLLAIADAAGGQWPQRAREAAVALVAASKENPPSPGIRLLADLRVVFAEADAMATVSILSALVALDESPWADIRGKALDDRGLAFRLKKYGVRPKVLRIGESTPRGYARADFHDAWSRYLPSSQANETSATSAANCPEDSLLANDFGQIHEG